MNTRILLILHLMAAACISWPACADPKPSEPDRDPSWAHAHEQPAMTVEEARAFMRRLTEYAVDHHMKKAEGSAQRGMMYEYWHVAREGQFDQFIQGEGLDTMHDGAWFAVAMVNAYRATGDPFYKDILVKWQMPFYLKMLNHSDELFTAEREEVVPGGDPNKWHKVKEWLLQGREKGFVPYWWDDGGSVSLDMLARKDEHVFYPARNELAGQPNPQMRLSGYSLGSSNHLALDLGVMLQQTWLLFRESNVPEERRLASEIADAARHLQECRARHGTSNISTVRAAFALSSGDASVFVGLPQATWKSVATAHSDYRIALFDFKKDKPVNAPPFADTEQHRYYSGIARAGTLTEPLAFWVAYDAFTLPKLYQAYCDDSPPPPGINVFAIHPYRFVNGRPVDLRSQRKGPGKGPRPIGSRFATQNMVQAGLALQAFKTYPRLWEDARHEITTPNFFPSESSAGVKAWLERELGGGLRTWEAIFKTHGFIPAGIGAGNCGAGIPWEELSKNGSYAHLISAASQWINYLEGRRDWELHAVPSVAAKAPGPKKSSAVVPTREELVATLRDLAREVESRFVVKDPQRLTFGMCYEFQDPKTGAQIQDFGLDAMHDGAWFMNALITAHRADPEGGHLDMARKYQIPFYVRMLKNSDTLFPHMLRHEGQDRFDKPVKGWAPRGWDDGPGIDLTAGKPFSSGVVTHADGTVIERDADGKFLHAYFTGSNHLYQDLADSLLNVWLTTRDPEVAEAIRLIQEGRQQYGNNIPVVRLAAGLSNGVEAWFKRPRGPVFDADLALQPFSRGVLKSMKFEVPRYNDGLAWEVGAETARAALFTGKSLDAGFIVNTAGRIAAQIAAEKWFYGTSYRPGLTLGNGSLVFENGKPKKAYDGSQMLFTRGQQYAWIGAAVVPALKDVSPEEWRPLFEAFAGVPGDYEFPKTPGELSELLIGKADDSITFWLGVRKQLGYLPRAWRLDGREFSWSKMAELGAYAHMMKTIACRIMILDGTSEWDLIRKNAGRPDH